MGFDMTVIIAVAALIVAAICATIAWRTTRAERARSAARVALLSAALDFPHENDAPPLFAAGAESIGQRHPLLKIGIGFAAVVTLIVVVAMTNDLYEESTTASASVQSLPSLVLLSMRHEQDAADTLTVTGVVRNEGRTPVEHITAVVFAFDKSGGFLTSGRAPLDLNTLAPGDNASFRIGIPHVADVGRYRVSFRGDTGVVRHMDRRASSPQSDVTMTPPNITAR